MYAIQRPFGDHAGCAWRCSLTVSCTGHPPSAGTTHKLFRPVMFETKTICFPSGDHEVSPMARVMYSFSIESFPTSALETLLICCGSVMTCTAGCWASVTVLIRITIAKAPSTQYLVPGQGSKDCTRGGSGFIDGLRPGN